MNSPVYKVLFFMYVIENDIQDILERRYITSKFIYTFYSHPQVIFYEKMVIFELILNKIEITDNALYFCTEAVMKGTTK